MKKMKLNHSKKILCRSGKPPTSFNWKRIIPENLSLGQLQELSIKLDSVSKSGFEREDFSFDFPKVEKTLLKNDILFILQADNAEIHGFAFSSVIPLDSYDTILYVAKICISSQCQNRGYGRTILHELCEEFKISILVAKTQNPLLMRAFEKLSTSTFPFNCSYETYLGKMILERLVESEVIDFEDITTETLSHGIIKGAYGGKLGKYYPSNQTRYDGIDRENGDAYIISSILKTHDYDE